MKKTIAILLALYFLLTLVACVSDTVTKATVTSETATTAETTTSTETPSAPEATSSEGKIVNIWC